LEQDFSMVWLVIPHLFATVLGLVHIRLLSDNNKELGFMILRHQLGVMPHLQINSIGSRKWRWPFCSKKPKNLKLFHQKTTCIVKPERVNLLPRVANEPKNRKSKVED
jgi:hypothetical protein